MQSRVFLTLSISILLMASYNLNAQVFINEVLINPNNQVNDNFIGNCNDTTIGSEYVELYNPSKCDTIDLECYTLGSRVDVNNRGAFSFPAGSKIAPLGFIVVGGPNAANVDFAIADYCLTGNYCGVGLWNLANTNGWIALYDASNTISDAVYWTPQAGQATNVVSNPAFTGGFCSPSACGSDTFPSARDLAQSSQIGYGGAVSDSGRVLHRTKDGAGFWQTNGIPTPGTCNGICDTASDLTINVDSLSDEICLGANGYIGVNASGGIPPYVYSWNNGKNGPINDELIAGAYTISVTDDEGCIRFTTFDIVNLGDTLTVIIDPASPAIIAGTSVGLEVLTNNQASYYIWSPTNDLNCGDCKTPVADPTVSTTYTVTVTDVNGCTETTTVRVRVVNDENSIFVPTAFSPNGDSKNDILFVRSARIEEIEFRIYDRWGREVFYTTNQNTGWNGLDKSGKELNQGIYVYFVKALFVNGKEKVIKGDVALLK